MLLDFKKLISARFLFTFAVQMQAVILGWHMYDLLRDPLALGFIGLAEAIPAIGLALFAGYIVDRSRPLVVYRRVILVSLVSSLIMLISQLLEPYLSLHARVAALYLSSALTGTARAFSQPSIFASVPRMVPKAQLLQATAWMSSAMQVARIAGPALGGILFGFFGMSFSAAFVCLCLFLAGASMKLIQQELSAPQNQHHHVSVKEEFLSGAKFVFGHPILLPALTLDMVSVLFGGVTALLPIFAKEILLIGPKGLGVLRAAPAIGAAAMSFFQARYPLRGRSGTWLLSSVAGFGLCILVFGYSRNYALSLTALILSGAFDSVSMVIRSAAVQLSSPDHLRGKISAVNSIFIGSSNEIGEFESGVAAKLLGTVPAVYFGGVMCFLTVALTSLFCPSLRKLDLKKL